MVFLSCVRAKLCVVRMPFVSFCCHHTLCCTHTPTHTHTMPSFVTAGVRMDPFRFILSPHTHTHTFRFVVIIPSAAHTPTHTHTMPRLVTAGVRMDPFRFILSPHTHTHTHIHTLGRPFQTYLFSYDLQMYHHSTYTTCDVLEFDTHGNRLTRLVCKTRECSSFRLTRLVAAD